MEDNRKFATFFADAPKGKKIGAVLSWIATVILLVALFVPGYQLRYQMKTEKGTFKDIPATMTSELKQMKEEAKLNFQFGAGTTSDKIDEFVEKGSTSVFSYLVSPDLQKARLVNLETMSDAPDDISKICVALLVLFFVLVVVAAIASVFTISWCALAANLIGIIELLAVYFFVFAGKFSIDPTDTSITSRVAPALTMILIVLLVLTAIMSVASVIVSYAVHEDEEAFVDDWNSNDPSRDAETNLVDDGNATTVPATDNSMTVVASLIQMNTNRSFAIYNNTEVVIGKGSQANIIVSNPIISRAHAKISCRNGVCTIQDLGSKNGTFVGDEKYLAKKAQAEDVLETCRESGGYGDVALREEVTERVNSKGEKTSMVAFSVTASRARSGYAFIASGLPSGRVLLALAALGALSLALLLAGCRKSLDTPPRALKAGQRRLRRAACFCALGALILVPAFVMRTTVYFGREIIALLSQADTPAVAARVAAADGFLYGGSAGAEAASLLGGLQYRPTAYVWLLAPVFLCLLLGAVQLAVEMNANSDFGAPVADYTDENVSGRVVKIIQSYTSIVNKTVWKKQ